MVKIALSAAIKQYIATGPRAGSFHSISLTMLGTGMALMGFYSYFQSGSSGCLRSQSGRRLLTTGVTAKLYSGGGEVVDHSSVHASHGSFPAGSPFKSDQARLATNTSTPAIWKNTPTVTIRFQISHPRPGSYV